MKRLTLAFVLAFCAIAGAQGQSGSSARNQAGESARASDDSPYVEIPPDLPPENFFTLTYNPGTPLSGTPSWYDVRDSDGFADDFKREFKVSFQGVQMSFPVAIALGRKEDQPPFPAPEFTVEGASEVDSRYGLAPTLPYQGFYMTPRISDSLTVSVVDKLKSYQVAPANGNSPADMAYRWSLGWVSGVEPVAITSSLLFKLPEAAASADTEYGLIVPLSAGGDYLSSVNPETNKPIFNPDLRAVYLHKPDNMKVKLWWEPADALRVWHTPFKARSNNQSYFANGEIPCGKEFVHKEGGNPVFIEAVRPVKSKLFWGVGDQYHAIQVVSMQIKTPSLPYGTSTIAVGPVNNVLSAWSNSSLVLQVDLNGLLTENTLPQNSISWSVPDHTPASNSMSATLSWTTPGTRQVLISVFGLKKRIVIDVPFVGTVSEATAAAMDPFAAANAILYANMAEDWAATALPSDPSNNGGGKANALQHSYWNALMASDALLGPATALFFSTAHEFTGKASGGLAYDSTMDLHNNQIGSLVTYTTILGTPDKNAIKSDLLNRLRIGDLWIIEKISQTNNILHVIRSDEKKIFPLR